MASKRYTAPELLDEATEFSSTPEFYSGVEVIRVAREHPEVWAALRDGTTVENEMGRNRHEGHWALAYLDFLVFPQPNLYKWHAKSSDELWREAGFERRPDGTHKPPYKTVWQRFGELEDESLLKGWDAATNKLIVNARQHEPEIGRHLTFDGTEEVSWAAPKHACPRDRECGWNHDWEDEHHRTTMSEGLRADAADVLAQARSVKRVSASTAGERRRDTREKRVLEKPRRDPVKAKRGKGRMPVYRIETANHDWLSFDPDAGICSYPERGDTWFGYHNIKLVDRYTGAPLFVDSRPGWETELVAYEAAYEHAMTLLNDPDSHDPRFRPDTVTADSGLGYSRFYKFNIKKGVAPITVDREKKGGGYSDYEVVDQDGVTRCRHCQGPTKRIRFHWDGENSREESVCALPLTPACQRQQQSFYCRENWRLIAPLRRDHPFFQEQLARLGEMERTNGLWRERYCVGPKTIDKTPKRMGVGARRLRARAALFHEWLLINKREGWLDGIKRSKSVRIIRDLSIGAARVAAINKRRKADGLTVPYGVKAAALLGEAFKLPPSKRAKVKQPAVEPDPPPDD